MRITVVYNRSAGDHEPSAHALARELKKGGYDPTFEISQKTNWDRVLQDPGAFVVAAGGDGTVTTVAEKLAGQTIPLAILPIGTANNIARSLGLPESPSSAIESWKNGRKRRLDVGVVRGVQPRNPMLFLEGVGVGLLAEGMQAARERRRAEARKSTTPVDGALRIFRETLSALRARNRRIRVDGEEIHGRFLLVEVLNMPAIGPDLALAPRADPSDGFFDVVTAADDARDSMAECFASSSSSSFPELPSRRAREVEIECAEEDGVVHVDGELCPLSEPETGRCLSIRFHPEPIEILGARENP
jgi:diacylglycerol kinase family enzyme